MSSSSFATSKRSSCDRCRKQKLRCPTKEDATQPCSRCLRAGVPCVVGYTRPRGRTQRNSFSQDSVEIINPPHLALATPNIMLCTGSDHATENESTQSWSLLDDHSYFPSLPSIYESGQTQASQDDASAGIYYSSLCRDLDVNNHTDTSSRSQDAFSALATAFASPDTDTCGLPGASNCTPNAMGHIECEIRLSQLNLDLCGQLKTQFLSPTSIAEAAVQTHASNPYSALSCVLQSTESYIQVLQSLTTCSSSGSTTQLPTGRSDPSITHDTSSRPPPLTFLCVLNVTSCFFRIVDLFNAFLWNLAKVLDVHHFVSPSHGLQVLPELKLAGLPVHEVSLQIKILVLAITHHFETMERLLDLPAELRVSEQPHDSTRGLLPAHWTVTLLSAKRELVELSLNGTGNYVQSIQLLRRNLIRLQRLF